MSFKIILLHWSNSFRFVHCAILSYTVHTVSNIVHISVIRWRKFVTKSELPTKKNDMVLFSVETGKRPCHFRIELIFVFLADASQVHRDVSADTSSPHKPEATPAYPSSPELQFSFWRTVWFEFSFVCPPFNFDSVKWIVLLHQQLMLRPTLVVWRVRFELSPTELRKYLESIITNEQMSLQPWTHLLTSECFHC